MCFPKSGDLIGLGSSLVVVCLKDQAADSGALIQQLPQRNGSIIDGTQTCSFELRNVSKLQRSLEAVSFRISGQGDCSQIAMFC